MAFTSADPRGSEDYVNYNVDEGLPGGESLQQHTGRAYRAPDWLFDW